jgi:hypothetical protein
MTPDPTDRDLLRAYLLERMADAACAWSVGTFGAVGEFSREPDEPFAPSADRASLEVSTARGALRLHLPASARAVAFEAPGASGGWQRTVALCLPAGEAASNARGTLTELGADAGAIRSTDRADRLFDLGFGCATADLCVRTADPAVLAALRARAGRPVTGPDGAALDVLSRAEPIVVDRVVPVRHRAA